MDWSLFNYDFGYITNQSFQVKKPSWRKADAVYVVLFRCELVRESYSEDIRSMMKHGM